MRGLGVGKGCGRASVIYDTEQEVPSRERKIELLCILVHTEIRATTVPHVSLLSFPETHRRATSYIISPLHNKLAIGRTSLMQGC